MSLVNNIVNRPHVFPMPMNQSSGNIHLLSTTVGKTNHLHHHHFNNLTQSSHLDHLIINNLTTHSDHLVDHSTGSQFELFGDNITINSLGDHMDSMKNYFHISFGDTILFKGWDIQSSGDVLFACFLFFVLAILYEGMKSLREALFRREARAGNYRLSLYNPTNGCPDDLVPTSGNLSASLNQSEEVPEGSVIKCSMFSKAHLCQSILHSVQVVISYTLMLGFMTFNTWICLSIATGAGIGYFLFCWSKLAFINVTDHCN